MADFITIQIQNFSFFFFSDIFMSYCGKDAPISRGSVIHPATVRDDLEKHGYKWSVLPCILHDPVGVAC